MIMNKCFKCGKEISPKAKQCRGCYFQVLTNRDQTGDKNPAWKGGKTLHTRGYVYVRRPDHPFCEKSGYIFEHRIVMEKKLGRYLLPDEIVHHINGIMSDNRPENLELVAQRDHLKRHNLLGTHTPKQDPITGRWLPKE